MKLPQGWHDVSDERAWMLGDQLNQAIPKGHFLYGRTIRVVAHRHQRNPDELLCWHSDQEDLFTLVHFSWEVAMNRASGHYNASPVMAMHGCFQDFLSYEVYIRERVLLDAADLVREAEEQGESRGIVMGEQRGIPIGENRGLAVGLRQGQIKILTRQLCRRFRTAPTEVLARVHSASAEQLDQWADNILTAQTLEQVFQADKLSEPLT